MVEVNLHHMVYRQLPELTTRLCWSNLWDQLGFSERPPWKKMFCQLRRECLQTLLNPKSMNGQREQKPGVKKNPWFVLQKVDVFLFASDVFVVSSFPHFFNFQVFNSKESFLVGWSISLLSQPLFPSKALQNAAARDFHRMAADASHAKEQRVQLKGIYWENYREVTWKWWV